MHVLLKKCILKNGMDEQWKRKWDEGSRNKLNKLEPVLRDRRSPGPSRRKEIVLSRVCRGHTCLTRSYLMNVEDVRRWVACGCELTVEHILIDCGDFAEVTQRYYDAENVQQSYTGNQFYICIGLLA